MGQGNAWLRVPYSSTDNQSGDNQWYQISAVGSSTSLTLKNPYTGSTLAAASTFTIGQAPLLPEDYQDLPLYRMGRIYYTTRFPDPVRAKEYGNLYDQGAAALDAEYGAKTTSVVLQDTDLPIINSNLYTRSLTQN